MKARYLLDTSAAILLRDATTDADARLLALASRPALSIITRVELEGGLWAEPELAGRRKQALQRMLQLFGVIDFDARCADSYRQIVDVCGYSRRKVMDRLIASTAIAHDLTIITCNERDFADIPDLALEVWPSA